MRGQTRDGRMGMGPTCLVLSLNEWHARGVHVDGAVAVSKLRLLPLSGLRRQRCNACAVCDTLKGCLLWLLPPALVPPFVPHIWP